MALFLPTLMSLLFPLEISVCAAGTDYEEGLCSQGRGAYFGVTVPLQEGLSCFSKFLVSSSDALLCSTASGYFTASWITQRMIDVCQSPRHCICDDGSCV